VAANPNLEQLHAAGASIWLDTLSRQLLQSGEFAELIRDHSVTGATSNPTIFAKAITGSDLYDGELRRLADAGQPDLQELFFSLALDDVRAAARELRPTFDESGGRDGYISFECTPDLADDTEAYQRGLAARVEAAERVEQIASVASFFLSRIDTKVDNQLPEDSPLRGRVAIASARVAYQRYLGKFAGDAWDRLEARGANRQRPLWASTGTKNPAYSDTRYVAELIGPDVINTMPDHTLCAFADHGNVARTLDADPEAAERTLADAAAAGIDLQAVTDELEREGVQSFCDSYHQLLDCIEGKLSLVAAS
jgi:transaldolase